MSKGWLNEVRWNKEGLIPVVVQDAQSRDVLMTVTMNRQALETTVREGVAVYWSPVRQSIHAKGEETGMIQEVVDIHLACKGDALLLSVLQHGGIACYTGRARCFYKRLVTGEQISWQEVEPVIGAESDI